MLGVTDANRAEQVRIFKRISRIQVSMFQVKYVNKIKIRKRFQKGTKVG